MRIAILILLLIIIVLAISFHPGDRSNPDRPTVAVHVSEQASALVSAQSTASGTRKICHTPLSLQVGQIDPQFKLSREEIVQVLRDATKEWTDATGRSWFVLSSDGETLVNFLFDGRQADLLAAEQERNAIEAEVKWANDHMPVPEAMAKALQARVDEYNNRQGKLNEAIPWAQHRIGSDGTSIDVFAFSDREQLHAVLLHELGHAIGLGHLPQKEAIMYEVRVPERSDIHLSTYDVEAALSLCEGR